MYLGAAGVGELVLVDDDQVDASNLQRQIAHREQDLGINKAQSAARAIKDLNSNTRVKIIERRLAGSELASQIGYVDLVIDATDNFDSRYFDQPALLANSNTTGFWRRYSLGRTDFGI